MGKVTGLHHLCVFTKDLEKSLHFYCDFLGFSKVYQTLEGKEDIPNDFTPVQYVLIKNGNCAIELLQPNHIDTVKQDVIGVMDHMGLAVEDLESFVEELKAKGLIIEDSIHYNNTLMNGFKNITLLGPSGEKVALYEFL